jgi:putative NADPH-quinone reductase
MVKKYQKKIDNCEHLVLIFPVWWSLMPAILKGFLDKVLLKKWAFDFSGWKPVGKLKHIKRATTIATLGGKSFLYKTFLGNPLHWALQIATLSFCGIRKKKVYLLSSVTTCSDSKRHKMLQKIGNYFEKLGG